MNMEFANREYLLLLLLIIPYILWYVMLRKKSEPTIRMADTHVFRYAPRSWRVMLMPLQMVLRQILVNNDMSAAAGTGASNRSGEDQATRMLLKYATIIVSVLPIICVYPFLQKYFTKGVMIGALKG